ncbi:hypothetical protein CQW23_02210 [Capsicum baccatum]|uniref:Myb/SANT-like domain-containing protein n=1 Tax=Capsicum baccatum TaxID=33114 RepID=A0A2G2XQS8_CAPBA|nr:hypothetical protein CQW23_02210 [Capsicum baccatum]
MSEFAWNPITHKWDAEPEVWDQLIQVKPQAAELKTKSFRNYEKLVMLYGKDKATGKHTETDDMCFINTDSLEDMVGHEQGDQSQATNDVPTPNVYSEAQTPSRNKKSKHDHLEGMTCMLKSGCDAEKRGDDGIALNEQIKVSHKRLGEICLDLFHNLLLHHALSDLVGESLVEKMLIIENGIFAYNDLTLGLLSHAVVCLFECAIEDGCMLNEGDTSPVQGLSQSSSGDLLSDSQLMIVYDQSAIMYSALRDKVTSKLVPLELSNVLEHSHSNQIKKAKIFENFPKLIMPH